MVSSRIPSPRPDTGLKRQWLWFGMGLSLIPALLTAWAIFRYPVYVLYWDDWTYVDLMYRVRSGLADFSNFWALANEHRPFFPRLVMIGIAHLTSWDPLWHFAFNYFLAAGVWGCFAFLVWRERAFFGPAASAGLTAAGALFVFSLRQYENWVWSAETVYFLPSLCSVACVVLLSGSRFEWKKFCAALALAFAACASFAAGFAVWPAGLWILGAAVQDPLRRLKVQIIWAFSALSMLAAYLSGYHRPPHHPPVETDPVQMILYLGNYLISPLSSVMAPGIPWIGLLTAALFAGMILYLRGQRIVPRRVWTTCAAPGVFSIVNGFLTAAGRAEFGLAQAFSPRYVTFSCHFWVALLLTGVLVLKAMHESRRNLGRKKMSPFSSCRCFLRSSSLRPRRRRRRLFRPLKGIRSAFTFPRCSCWTARKTAIFRRFFPIPA